jgi:hypothetical protein
MNSQSENHYNPYKSYNGHFSCTSPLVDLKKCIRRNIHNNEKPGIENKSSLLVDGVKCHEIIGS